MAGIEAAGMAAHRDQPGFFLQIGDGLRVGQGIGERDLDLHMLAGLQAGDRLRRVHLGGRAQDHRIDLAKREAVGEVG